MSHKNIISNIIRDGIGTDEIVTVDASNVMLLKRET